MTAYSKYPISFNHLTIASDRTLRLDNQPQDSRRATAEPDGSSNFLAGGGEMGALLRSHDWAQLEFGAP